MEIDEIRERFPIGQYMVVLAQCDLGRTSCYAMVPHVRSTRLESKLMAALHVAMTLGLSDWDDLGPRTQREDCCGHRYCYGSPDT